MDQAAIIKRASGLSVQFNKHYRNPFREDKSPGCFFQKTGKYIRFWDYADDRFNGMHCFDMVLMAEKGVRLKSKDDFMSALSIIKDKYHIPVGPIKTTTYKPFRFHLEVHPAEWGRKHIEFWKKYGITVEQLEEDGVFPAYSYTHNSKKNPKSLITRRAEYPAFCYDRGGRHKLYQPYGQIKWLNKHRTDDIYQWEGVGPTLVLGSYKDAKIVANTGQSTIALALENSLPRNLPEDSIIIGDFDKAGNKMKERFVKEGKNALIWESPYQDMKDVAELYLKYGPKKLYSFINYAIREGSPKSSRFSLPG